MTKTMLVLYVPPNETDSWANYQLIKGGFDMDREIIQSFEIDEEQEDGDVLGAYLMQEIEPGKNS